jgi:hypothetical protein
MASNPLYAIIWLILLLFIAWPIASLLAIVWIVLQVRSAGTSCHWTYLPSNIQELLSMTTNNACMPGLVPMM